MKRFFSLFAGLLLWGSMSVAVAGAGDLLFFGGTPFPFGDTNGGLYGEKKGGWEAGAGYDWPVDHHWSLRFEGSHFQMPNAVTFDGLSPMKVTNATVNSKIFTCCKHKVKPYFLMGVGFAQINVLVDTGLTQLTFSSTEFLVKIGGGFEFDAGKKWGLFVESFVFQSEYLSLIPVRAGMRLKL